MYLSNLFFYVMSIHIYQYMFNIYVDIVFHCTFPCIVQHIILSHYDAIPVTYKSLEHGKHAEHVL